MGMAAFLLAASAANICAGVGEPIIDMHLHSYDRDGRLEAHAPNPATGANPTVNTGAEHALATAAAARSAGVVRGIVAGNSPATDDRIIAHDTNRTDQGFANCNHPALVAVLRLANTVLILA